MRPFESDNPARKSFARKVTVCTGLLLAFAAGLATTLWIARAQAAPPSATPTLTSELAMQIAGKAGPSLSISADAIPADYRLIELIDAQGKSGYYATRGESLAIGADNYLLAYQVNVFNDEAGEQKIARGQSLDLSLVNLHQVEVIRQIGALPEAATPPPPRRAE
jgi:hypothetical protein